ncbi:unnamed protein product [Brassica oleracea]
MGGFSGDQSLTPSVDSGQACLKELGYKQELKRDLSLVYGWFVAGVFAMCVGLSMAEICSSYPTSGGLYYWIAMLAGPRWAPLASWLTGCEKGVCLQWAVTASVDFSLAQLIQVIVLLSTGGKNGGGYEGSDYVVIAIHGGNLIHTCTSQQPPYLRIVFHWRDCCSLESTRGSGAYDPDSCGFYRESHN